MMMMMMMMMLLLLLLLLLLMMMMMMMMMMMNDDDDDGSGIDDANSSLRERARCTSGAPRCTCAFDILSDCSEKRARTHWELACVSTTQDEASVSIQLRSPHPRRIPH
jgi:hypothetical protein